MAYDSAATKERILAAATAEFAAYGVAGARVDRIAAQAEANKRAIYEYFGDKQQLFAAVLERLMADLARDVPPGDDDLPAYAERLFDHHRAHPEALRLLMWEALELGDRPVPAEDVRTRHYQDKARAAATAHPDDDPRSRLFFTLGLVAWTLTMPHLRRMILGPDTTLDQLRPAIAHAVEALPTERTPDEPA
ncbi:TetR family transcriptional regulator [Embleya scabrispora]|uniref:TetR family transcriptional regulator n=1 Tax=Embleya scabrispora TaxID=159449 RepID=A0A1T3NQV2_9ACTN|nr:TetR family transcriptional regulator [Embleya scabrispora]OPC79199.1 TetR family transcriptional regulator [Embleya scabrispora]